MILIVLIRVTEGEKATFVQGSLTVYVFADIFPLCVAVFVVPSP